MTYYGIGAKTVAEMRRFLNTRERRVRHAEITRQLYATRKAADDARAALPAELRDLYTVREMLPVNVFPNEA